MKKFKKSFVKFLKSRARWNSKIQSNALADNDLHLIVNTTILGELCTPFLHLKNSNYFTSVNTAELIETAPNLFFEHLCLHKKYAPETYQQQYTELVATYQTIVKDMYTTRPTIDQFSLMLLTATLHEKRLDWIAKKPIHITHDLIENQPKEAVEAVVDMIFYQTNFGLEDTIVLDEKSITALETLMVAATKEFEFLFIARILRTLAYVNAPKSKQTKIAEHFLRNYTPRKINLTLKIVTEKGTENVDVDTEMVRFNKEIVIALLEWKTGFRFYRDFGK